MDTVGTEPLLGLVQDQAAVVAVEVEKTVVEQAAVEAQEVWDQALEQASAQEVWGQALESAQVVMAANQTTLLQREPRQVQHQRSSHL